MVSFPYYSQTTPIRIPKDMGIVWETNHKGVPLLGVPGITLWLKRCLLPWILVFSSVEPGSQEVIQGIDPNFACLIPVRSSYRRQVHCPRFRSREWRRDRTQPTVVNLMQGLAPTPTNVQQLQLILLMLFNLVSSKLRNYVVLYFGGSTWQNHKRIDLMEWLNTMYCVDFIPKGSPAKDFFQKQHIIYNNFYLTQKSTSNPPKENKQATTQRKRHIEKKIKKKSTCALQ